MTVFDQLSAFRLTTGIAAAAGASLVAVAIPVGAEPHGVAVAPDGGHVYVTNISLNTVSVIDTTTNTVVTTIPVGAGPRAVAVTARNVYVANGVSDTVSIIDV